MTTPVRTPVAGAAAASTDLVSIGLDAAAQELLSEGYRAVGVREQGFLAPAMRTLSQVEVAPRTCLAIAAAATPSIGDLDAALYADDGSVLAEDDSASPRPVLRLCSAERALSGHLALHAFQGAGSYAVQRFEKPLGASDAPEARSGEGAASAGFLELLRSLHARGYQDEAPLISVRLTPASALRVAIRGVAGHCYSVVADGAGTELRLLSREGNELSRGLSGSGPAALQYCASRDAELTLELSARSEQPALRVARLWARQRDVGGARSLWLGEPSPLGFDAVPPLAKAAEKPERCAAPSQALVSAHALAQGAVWDAPLPGTAACVWLEAQLHQGLVRATLRVEDADGATLDERELVAPQGSLYVCGRRGPGRVAVIARAGFGAISVASRSCRE